MRWNNADENDPEEESTDELLKASLDGVALGLCNNLVSVLLSTRLIKEGIDELTTYNEGSAESIRFKRRTLKSLIGEAGATSLNEDKLKEVVHTLKLVLLCLEYGVENYDQFNN